MVNEPEIAMHATDTLEGRARRRVALKLSFALHATVFVAVNLGLAVLGRGHVPLWGWALGLAIHGLVVALNLVGEGLQRRLLDREIEALRRRPG